ncbi:MAG TPA: type IV secretory system conjugative DNA transfer family protein [Candidatus Paceibacterota bacterium]|nr:type IV secretory system conjugative DNA transfer family protein [Candidatus Paceibacterota bacterium]
MPSLQEIPNPFGRSSNPEAFQSPEEELAYLRQQVAEKERMISTLEHGQERPLSPEEREVAVTDVIHEYQTQDPREVLSGPHQMPEDERKKIALDLAPEEHDSAMEELVWILENRGIMNALSVVEEMGNPHIEDDFHRLLVQYVKKNESLGTRKNAQVFESLHMTLYEVLLPEDFEKEEVSKGLKELLSNMEQFYQGMLSVKKEKSGFWDTSREYFTLEIAMENHLEEVVFYAAVPDDSCDLFEKQITSLFPNARIEEKKDDYNIFNYEGSAVGSYAVPSGTPLFPIKTYESFDQDPLNVILNTFSKIQEKGEGAALQFIVAPAPRRAFFDPYQKALEKIQKGEKTKTATKIPKTGLGIAFRTVKESLQTTGTTKPEDAPKDPIDEEAVKNISEKITTPIFETNIRIVASAANHMRAQKILTEMESAFHQFEKPRGNGIRFVKIPDHKLHNFFHRFSFRLLSGTESFPLNTAELTTVFHFPSKTVTAYQLKHARARTAPAPVRVPREGIVLGINNFRGNKTEIRFDREDRVRHFYAIGQTGTGKSTLLKNMVVQDIQNGDGVCMIDPHGNDIDDILANIPKERLDDVIYFDPSHTAEPMGLNMLEYDPAHPEQKTFVVNEMMSIFEKLFGAGSEGLGPMFQQYFRNSCMLVVEDPETGSTLFDISRVLSDEKYRELKLSRCHNPVVVQFWREIATKAGGEASLQNIVPYITSKFDVFLANDFMRPIVAQEHSSFNFRRVMDEKKILLVNLSKGRLGDINSSLLGLIIVGKILMAALSRVDSLSISKPNDFYLYIDEFQNVTTDSIATILSEARKYRLSLNIAHQFIAQLDDKIRDAVFGNVGSMAAFRVGAEDAKFLESQFAPIFSAADIMRIDNRNAYLKMLVEGQPAKPFNVEIPPPEAGVPELVPKIKQLSYLKYGTPREEIERRINERYNKK